MKQKIKEALQQGHKNLGLSDEAFERVAAFGETFIKEETDIEGFVNGEATVNLLKSYQSAADKVRNELNAKIKGLEGEKADLEAKLNGKQPSNEPPKTDPQPQDMAKIIADAVAAAIKPISDEFAGFKAEKTVSDTVATVNSRIDAWGYGKGYPKEMEKARESAMELYEAYGKKWTADELEAKIKEKFNKEVRDKGIDTTEPYKSDGGTGTDPKEADKAFADEIRKALGMDKGE
ncbi:MAG: hypothetical protein NC226_09415 [Bacteroides cellulosilyticus]|nr:hypothetical protein [Bacteroides cellulosilyticus]